MARQSFREELAVTPLERLPDNAELLQQAVAGGRAAFQIHCVQCHGSGAAGSQELGYPNLNDDDWLWGGDIRAIEYTLVHGIREPGDAETRIGQMPAFAGAIEGERLDALVDHVLSLSDLAEANAAGAVTYAENCALCHGANGEGGREFGAPRLNDAIWLRGNSREAVTRQILNPRLGMMPAWGERLDPATISMLSAYVHSLGGGEDFVEVAADPAIEVDEQS